MKAVVVSAMAALAVALVWSSPARADDPPPIGSIPLSEILSTLDRNGNACVDFEEGRNYASRRFHALDRNHDGSLDAEEAPPGPEETTNSRPISIADWQDAYHARFAAFDADGSGCLSLQEVETGRNASKGGH